MIDQKHFSNLGSTLGGKGWRAWQKFLIDQSEKRMQAGQLYIDKHWLLTYENLLECSIVGNL